VAGQVLALLAARPRLIVSLPQNSAALARAAAEGGADALKVHLNVRHDASGTQFGSFAEERGSLEEILAVGLPTGIVPGVAGSLPTPGEMEGLAEMGLDFFDLYDHDMPAWMTRFEGMTRTVAISPLTPIASLNVFDRMGFEMMEAAIVPHEGYGEALSAADLARYHQVRAATSLPIIVPTQRAVAPEDMPALLDTGVNALMIGAIVTGREPDQLRAATRRFVSALASACG
jgi:hypothetical protein